MKNWIRHISLYFLTAAFLLSVSGITLYEHTCPSCGVNDVHFFVEGDCQTHDNHPHAQTCSLENHEQNCCTDGSDVCHKPTGEHESKECCQNTPKNFKIAQPYIFSVFKIKKIVQAVSLEIHGFETFVQKNNAPVAQFAFLPPKIPDSGGSFAAFTGCFLL